MSQRQRHTRPSHTPRPKWTKADSGGGRGTPPAIIKATPSIVQAVTDNNAFLFGQSLLSVLGSLENFRKEQELGNIVSVQDKLAVEIRIHPDPPMFIINALIAVGTVAKIRLLDADFEFAISKMLIAVLEQYKEWHQMNPDARPSTVSLPPTSYSDNQSSPSPGFEYEVDAIENSQSTTNPSKPVMQDLIALDEQDFDFHTYTQTKGRHQSSLLHHVKAHLTGNSNVSLLNDDSDNPDLKDVMILRPMVQDLIDISNWDSMDSSPLLSTLTAPASISNSTYSMDSGTNKDLLTGDIESEYMPGEPVLQIDLSQLEKANQLLAKRTGGQNDHVVDLQELVDMFESNLDSEKEGFEAEAEAEVQDSTQYNDSDGSLIQTWHREKILTELSTRKYILQVYVALEVMELQNSLLLPAGEKGDAEETYGSILANELFQMRRYRECATIIAKYLHHEIDMERELLPQLLEMVDQDAIQTYVDDSKDVCYRVLWHINHQLSFQFYYWGIVIPELAQTVPPEYIEIPPIKGVGKSVIQTSLVEIGLSLIMRFELESEQDTFGFLNIFLQYCTVVSLLDQPSINTNVSFMNGASTPVLGASKSRSKGYTMKNAWKFYPLVLRIVKELPLLQQMTIQHLIEKRDLVSAEYFAQKLGMMEYFQAVAQLNGEASSEQLPSLPFITSSTSSLPAPAPASSTRAISGGKRLALETSMPPGQVWSIIPFYKLPENTHVVFVDNEEQLDAMATSLMNSAVVGMDTEWLPVTEEFKDISKGHRTAILQLACHVNLTVYLVDTIAFLEDTYSEERLVEILGTMFNNPDILKVAYDWDGDQELLEATFPGLYDEQYRLQNMMDMKYLWFKSRGQGRDGNETHAGHRPSTPLGIGAAAANDLEKWSMVPSTPGMQVVPGGLSGLLVKICGQKLDKSQRCSNWEQRPLTSDQLNYAAVDALCLLDIYAVLETIEQLQK
ncbi:Exonuclease mut-7 [Haplosporangium sp. Z 11]|nr:Exonuclease mut-7 [Haplosporangium sp. Z 11]